MPKHLTDGKIIYIHGATPKRIDQPIEADMDRWREIDAARQRRVTLPQLEAGENDPALGWPMPAAPSVRYIGADFGTEEPISVEGYYGLDGDPQATYEPDEFVVWSPDKTSSGDERFGVNWRAAAVGIVIILMLAMILAGAVSLASLAGLQHFLQNLAPTLK